MTHPNRITVLAGGVGGARFTRGLLHHINRIGSPTEVTVVVNTGDDMWLTGLRVCPDLDTVMYTLGGGINEEQGWGRPDESSRTAGEIHAYGRGWPWFTLGDLDLGTHIVRSDLLRDGHTLSEATAVLCERWRPGARLLPMSDQPVETHVRLITDVDEHRAGELIHFEEWWVRYRARVDVAEFVQVGVDDASPAPGVIDAITTADTVILPPSNPVVSVGTILGVPGIRDAVRATGARVVGVSPIIGDAAVRGMADSCLSVIDLETSAAAVGLHYGSRVSEGVLDAWLVDEVDAAAVPVLEASGIHSRAVPLWMRDLSSSAAIARATLAL
ncbi:2-phospho-L-lactate transferase [Okibacterium endophyticum]